MSLVWPDFFGTCTNNLRFVERWKSATISGISSTSQAPGVIRSPGVGLCTSPELLLGSLTTSCPVPLPETNSSHLETSRKPKRKGKADVFQLPIHFQVPFCHVSFKEGRDFSNKKNPLAPQNPPMVMSIVKRFPYHGPMRFPTWSGVIHLKSCAFRPGDVESSRCG